MKVGKLNGLGGNGSVGFGELRSNAAKRRLEGRDTRSNSGQGVFGMLEG